MKPPQLRDTARTSGLAIAVILIGLALPWLRCATGILSEGGDADGDGDSDATERPVCDDGVCEEGETTVSCPADCHAVCGDGTCEAGQEDSLSCVEDCPESCGDDVCTSSEDAESCPVDCPATCGDGRCGDGEDAGNCPGDCPAACGDGICTHDEDSVTCPDDCPARCGDGICSPGEGSDMCPEDCPLSCGDGDCTHEEDAASCPDDCPAVCGDGACTHSESSTTCEGDCPATCGDGACTLGESARSCPDDCPATCGDGACTHDETASSCPDDCPAACGDGDCTHDETAARCEEDCPAACGDDVCTHDETASSCAGDCPAVCGDGACTHGETPASCARDCPAVCGDGACSSGETVESCAADCGCAAPGACSGAAPAGCRCDAGCVAARTCCTDACAVCGSCECVVDRDITATLGGASTTGNNATGRNTVDGCVSGDGPEAVYTVTPAFTDDLTVSLVNAGTGFDTALSVREGGCGGREVACNDDFAGLSSQVTFAATSGTRYFIIVEGYGGSTGAFELTAHREGVCEGLGPRIDGTPIIAEGTRVIDTSTGVSSLSGRCGGGSGNEGILTFTAPRDGSVVVSTNYPGTTFDTLVYVREGDCDAQGVEVACNDDDGQNASGSSVRSEVVFPVRAARVYSVILDAFSTGAGNVEVGLGYGGTSPVQGSLGACGFAAAPDVYRVFVNAGDDLHVRADTVSAATASDLCIRVYDTNGTTQLDSFDDDVACTFPPPSFSCPDGTITDVPTRGFVFVHVRQCSTSCADASNIRYRLSVERNGGAAVLMATDDN
jgi:hypothetical protein